MRRFSVRIRVRPPTLLYTSGVTVARLAPTQLVRVQIFGGMPKCLFSSAEQSNGFLNRESGVQISQGVPTPLVQWNRTLDYESRSQRFKSSKVYQTPQYPNGRGRALKMLGVLVRIQCAAPLKWRGSPIGSRQTT